MPRGGARPGAGRKAKDQPRESLLTYSFTVRPSDVGMLNQLGYGNLSLGLRRLVDHHRLRASAASTAATAPAGSASPLSSQPGAPLPSDPESIRGEQKGTT